MRMFVASKIIHGHFHWMVLIQWKCHFYDTNYFSRLAHLWTLDDVCSDFESQDRCFGHPYAYQPCTQWSSDSLLSADTAKRWAIKVLKFAFAFVHCKQMTSEYWWQLGKVYMHLHTAKTLSLKAVWTLSVNMTFQLASHDLPQPGWTYSILFYLSTNRTCVDVLHQH